MSGKWNIIRKALWEGLILNIKMLKFRARNIIKKRGIKLIAIAIIFVSVQLILSYLIEDLAGMDDYYEAIYSSLLTSDEMDYDDMVNAAVEAAENYEYSLPGLPAIIFIVLIYFSSFLITVGYRYQTLSESRGSPQGYGALFFGFNHPLKALAIELLIMLRIALVPVLLVVAGTLAANLVSPVLGGILELAAMLSCLVLLICASLKYSQSLYVFFDHPDYSPSQCLAKSAELMNGKKRTLFIFELSFIPWILVASLSSSLTLIPIFDIWLDPYYYISLGNFYTDLTFVDPPSASFGENNQ